MVRFLAGLLALIVLCAFQAKALAEEPRVIITILLEEQKMAVEVEGHKEYTWAVSTGKDGFRTPKGTFFPQFLDAHHRSSIYNNAPMPYSVFFKGGIAIHGTTEIKRLGTRASHGCVRLLTENARTLFNFIEKYGMKNVQIIVR